MTIATRTEVKTFLGITGTDKDALIDALLPVADGVAEAYTGRAISQAAVTDFLRGGGESLVASAWPVTSVVVSDMSGTTAFTVSTDDYSVDEARGIITRQPIGASWPMGHRRWRVAYTGGWADGSAPDEIKWAVSEIISLIMSSSDSGLLQERDMDYSYARSVTLMEGFIPPAAKLILNRYRSL